MKKKKKKSLTTEAEDEWLAYQAAMTEHYLPVMRRDGTVLRTLALDLRTEALCLAAVTQNGLTLQHVPQDIMTVDLCSIAVIATPACVCAYVFQPFDR